MDALNNLITINGNIETENVKSIQFLPNKNKWKVVFMNGVQQELDKGICRFLTNPKVFHVDNCRLTKYKKDLKIENIKDLRLFADGNCSLWRIVLKDCKENIVYLHGNTLKVEESCLWDKEAKKNFDYLFACSELNDLKAEDGTLLLPKQFKKIQFVEDDSPLATYLNSDEFKSLHWEIPFVIFPFGCNSSQFQAVKNALNNSLSIIQGPPGTGKTQTILNIIANLLLANKTVQVVSNNNSAIENILEKLQEDKYGLDFLVALLGSQVNKDDFISNQKDYPKINVWACTFKEKEQLKDRIYNAYSIVNKIFDKQIFLAKSKNEYNELKIEYEHFKVLLQDLKINDLLIEKEKIKDSKLYFSLWQKWNKKNTEKDNVFKWIKFLFLRLRCIFGGIGNWHLYEDSVNAAVCLQHRFYRAKFYETENIIKNIENELKKYNADSIVEQFTKESLCYLKMVVYEKYKERIENSRVKFSINDLWQKSIKVLEEYPIILSTTFSARKSLSSRTKFDYVIMDEASQVDLATGVLALSCAKSAVIVGDSKQLPNVINSHTIASYKNLINKYCVPDAYNFLTKSFLESVCLAIKDIPQTLLKEHYRCHPKIINFCNKKFYDNQLVIMTEDNGEEEVLQVIKNDNKGTQHGNVNYREADIVKFEINKLLDKNKTNFGVISPFRDQVDEIRKTLSKYKENVDTVHKFQGREKDCIMLTTVIGSSTESDRKCDFVNDPYLLNVAVSRARNNLILITTDGKITKNTIIGDLLDYITYNDKNAIKSSPVHSIFDLLAKEKRNELNEYLKQHKTVSNIISENLMYSIIEEIKLENKMPFLEIAIHYPFKMLLRDYEKLKMLGNRYYEYATNSWTHVDFLLYDSLSHKPILVVEVDGFSYHHENSLQKQRDKMKNAILELYGIPYIRFSTMGSQEKEKLTQLLKIL